MTSQTITNKLSQWDFSGCSDAGTQSLWTPYSSEKAWHPRAATGVTVFKQEMKSQSLWQQKEGK